MAFQKEKISTAPFGKVNITMLDFSIE